MKIHFCPTVEEAFAELNILILQLSYA